MVLGILLPLLLQLWDRRRLSAAQRARSWNLASWACALYAFGPASLLGWYWVTRHGWARLLGPLAAGALVLVLVGLDALLAALLGLETEP
ncbi:MAG: transcriptional regulator [Deltaproteobacteria bacterium]|nr:transcriptional regulator [Deltaproteobacteria bacterium]